MSRDKLCATQETRLILGIDSTTGCIENQSKTKNEKIQGKTIAMEQLLVIRFVSLIKKNDTLFPFYRF